MQLIDVELSELTLRRRSVPVSHYSAGLAAALEPGDPVVLRDSTGEYYSATVADLSFDLADTHYRLEIGVRLPEEIALDRLAGFPAAFESEALQELLELIGQARGATVTPSSGEVMS
ncbi:hypothetical protein [Nocardioides sp.]|uniref:hypothetical protein n=1 Tax=Nocardioides sp. TaxID=35761 RepID=UPI0027337760|nr:hypothetical protein [Nocardioides sp.]MDP3890104.1 hypothetical protein [Nocardioides sp.]